MRFSQSTEYALDSMLYVAVHPERKTVSADELAEAQGISPSYLTKVLQKLVAQGLLKSQRGHGGGYSLAKSAQEITLRDIILVFESDETLFDCFASLKGCGIAGDCLIVQAVSEAQGKMFEVLDRVTLAEVSRHASGRSGDVQWLSLSPSGGPASGTGPRPMTN